MTDLIIILVVLLILGGAAGYVYKAKKSGQKCIGCPHARACAGKCGECDGSCNCNQ